MEIKIQVRDKEQCWRCLDEKPPRTYDVVRRDVRYYCDECTDILGTLPEINPQPTPFDIGAEVRR